MDLPNKLMMLKVLFLCTENACRSQMAEGLADHFLAGKARAFSAGVKPTRVNPRAIQVLAELGIDIRHHRAKSLDELSGETFDLVITLCDEARDQCPIFPGATPVVHLGFPDPARATGSEETILAAFRRVRDDIRGKVIPFLEDKITAGGGQGS
jgi:arsenate reductase